jgi:osmotically-inducible protein OsmY
MFTHFHRVALTIAVVFAVETAVWAQTTGSFGSRTTGSGSTGTTQTAQGSSAFGTSTNANSGNSGMGGNNSNNSAGGTDFTNSNAGTQMMSTMSSMGFVGANSSSNSNSVLGGVGSSQNNNQNRNTTTQNQNLNLNTNTTFQQNTTNTTSNRYTVRDVPTKLNIAFDHPATAKNSTTTVQMRSLDAYRGLPDQSQASSVKIVMENGTAILQGFVASKHDRAIAEQLARLEPGVWKIKNELEVRPAADSSSPE